MLTSNSPHCPLSLLCKARMCLLSFLSLRALCSRGEFGRLYYYNHLIINRTWCGVSLDPLCLLPRQTQGCPCNGRGSHWLQPCSGRPRRNHPSPWSLCMTCNVRSCICASSAAIQLNHPLQSVVQPRWPGGPGLYRTHRALSLLDHRTHRADLHVGVVAISLRDTARDHQILLMKEGSCTGACPPLRNGQRLSLASAASGVGPWLVHVLVAGAGARP